MAKRIVVHQVNGKGGSEMMSVLTVNRLVEMGILRYVDTSESQIDQYDGTAVTVEVRSYRKA